MPLPLPLPTSSAWQRNCVKNYSGILITLVNILLARQRQRWKQRTRLMRCSCNQRRQDCSQCCCRRGCQLPVAPCSCVWVCVCTVDVVVVAAWQHAKVQDARSVCAKFSFMKLARLRQETQESSRRWRRRRLRRRRTGAAS